MNTNRLTEPHPEDKSQRLDRLVMEYTKAVEAGESPNPLEWIARHPDLANELGAYFAGEQRFNRMAGSLQPPLGTVRYFGDYELVDEIGRGGMGVVYKARQVSLNRLVALKMILAGRLAGENDLRRFRTEAEAAAKLDHPNILPVYEVGDHNGLQYFTMRLVDGSLSRRMEDLHKRPREAVDLLVQVARGVHHAHQRGVLHRDLKPGNVLLCGNTPLIADFGLARKIEGGDLTQTGAIVGTPSYMSPEQAKARKDLSTAIDVYSLGAILYEMLTGQPPFRAATAVETVLQVLEKEPVAPRVLQPRVDRDLETIALKCLDKDPHKRYDSAAALADDLERRQRGEPIFARRTSGAERAVKWVRRHALVSGMAAAVFLVLLAGIVVSSVFAMSARQAAEEARDAEKTAQSEKTRADKEAEDAKREADRADKKAEDADREAKRADREAKEAKAARAGADQKAKEAQSARERADREAKEAKTQARQANDARHALQIDQALRAWKELDADRMANVLADLHPDYHRTWETGHVRALWLAQTSPLQTYPGRPGEIKHLSYSPDGKRILTIAEEQFDPSRERTVRLWDAETGREKVIGEGHAGEIAFVAFSPDGNTILTVDHDNKAELRDTRSNRVKAVLGVQAAMVRTATFSPDGKRILIGGASGIARVWSTATGAELASLKVPAWVTTWSSDGKYALVAPTGKGKAMVKSLIRVWDVEAGKEKSVLQTPGLGSIAAFSPEGKRLFANGRIWSVETGEAMAILKTADFKDDKESPLAWRIQHAAFSPDGKTILVSYPDANRAVIWDTETGELKRELKSHSSGVVSVAFSADGKLALTGSRDKTAIVWNAQTGQRRTVLKGHTVTVGSVAFSPDGKTVLTGGRFSAGPPTDGAAKFAAPKALRKNTTGRLTARVREAATGRNIAVLTFDEHAGHVLSAEWDHKGKHVLTASEDGTARIWDGETGRELVAFKGHEGAVLNAVFSPDGKRVLTGGRDGTARIWDAESGRELLAIKEHSKPMTVRSWSPDGTRILTRNQGEGLRVRDATTGKEKAVLGKFPFSNVTWAPDGKQVFVRTSENYGEGYSHLFNADTGEETARTRLRSEKGTSMIWSPDGKSLLTDDGHVLDAKTGEEKLLLKGAAWPACWSSDGKRILAQGPENTVGIWDATTGWELNRFRGPSPAVRLAVAPDGKTVLVSYQDGSIRTWLVDRAREIVLGDRGQGAPARKDSGVKMEAWSPDGKRLFTWAAEQSRILDAETGREIASFKHRTLNAPNQWSPGGDLVLTWNDNETACIRDGRTGQEKFTLRSQWDSMGFRPGTQRGPIAFSPDGKLLLLDGRTSVGKKASKERPIQVRDAVTGEVKAAFGAGGRLDWTPDSKHVIAVESNTVRLFEAVTGKETAVFTGGEHTIRHAAISPDGKKLFFEESDKRGRNTSRARLMDVATGREIAILKGVDDSTVSILWAADGKRLLTLRKNRSKIEVWAADTGLPITAFECDQHWGEAVAWSPDGLRILAPGLAIPTGKPLVRIHDARTGKVEKVLEGEWSRASAVNWVKLTSWRHDGKCILVQGKTASSEFAAIIFDAETGKEKVRLDGYVESLKSASWSVDGQHLFAVDDTGAARAWDVETGRQTAFYTWDSHGSISRVTWSRDGKRLLVESRGNLSRLWEAETGRELAVFDFAGGDRSSSALSPDGKRIYQSDPNGSVCLINAETNRKTVFLNRPGGNYHNMALSPDGKRLLTLRYQNSKHVAQLWDAETGRATRTLKWEWGSSFPVVWSPDGRRLISCGSSNMVVHDAETGEQQAVLRGDAFRNGAAWSPDSKRLLTNAPSGTMRVWDAASRREELFLKGHPAVGSKGGQGNVGSVAWSPDGKRLLSGGNDGFLRMWDAETGQELIAFRAQGGIREVAWSKDGHRVLAHCSDGIARAWSAKPPQEVAFCAARGTSVVGASWSADGQAILTEHGDGSVRVWDVATSREKLRLWGRGQLTAFSPDQKRIASAGFSLVKVSNVETGLEIAQTQVLWGSGCRRLLWSPDGKRLLATAFTKTLILDAESGKVLATLAEPLSDTCHLTWAPDSRSVLSLEATQTNIIRVWDAETGREKTRVERPRLEKWLAPKTLVQVQTAWSADGKRLLSWRPPERGNRGEPAPKTLVQVHDTESGRVVVTLEALTDLPEPFPGASSGHQLAISPDGKWFLAADPDHAMCVRDAATGERKAVLAGHARTVLKATFSPDGKRAMTIGEDQTVRVWDIEPAIAGGAISEAEANSKLWADLAPVLKKADQAQALAKEGHTLRAAGKMDEAIARFRKAIELTPNDSAAHLDLGIALHNRRKLPEAIESLKKAVALDARNAHKQNWLGHALQEHGAFDEAIVCFRKALDLEPKNSWAGPALARSQRLAGVVGKLPALLSGEHQPADNAERLALIELTTLKNLHRTSARLYTEAFAADPKLTDNPRNGHRYNAACSAALAAAGNGEDAAKLEDKERTALRKKTLDWLNADLVYWAKQIDPVTIQGTMKHWQTDTDLACIRDAAALEKLPPEEKAACVKLWTDVAALLKKAADAEVRRFVGERDGR